MYFLIYIVLLTHNTFLYSSVKIHDLAEMKEIYAIITLEDAGGTVQGFFQTFLNNQIECIYDNCTCTFVNGPFIHFMIQTYTSVKQQNTVLCFTFYVRGTQQTVWVNICLEDLSL